jgi:hypothetical protein
MKNIHNNKRVFNFKNLRYYFSKLITVRLSFRAETKQNRGGIGEVIFLLLLLLLVACVCFCTKNTKKDAVGMCFLPCQMFACGAFPKGIQTVRTHPQGFI